MGSQRRHEGDPAQDQPPAQLDLAAERLRAWLRCLRPAQGLRDSRMVWQRDLADGAERVLLAERPVAVLPVALRLQGLDLDGVLRRARRRLRHRPGSRPRRPAKEPGTVASMSGSKGDSCPLDHVRHRRCILHVSEMSANLAGSRRTSAKVSGNLNSAFDLRGYLTLAHFERGKDDRQSGWLVSLITQRSQVQILPPLLKKCRSEPDSWIATRPPPAFAVRRVSADIPSR